MTRQSLHPLTRQKSSVEEITLQFAERLCTMAENATTKRSAEIIEAIFSSVTGVANGRPEKGATSHAAAERRRLVATFTAKMANAIEQATNVRVRELLDHWRADSARASHAAEVAAPLLTSPSLTPAETKRRCQVRRRPPSRPKPMAQDPRQIERDAELARLRRLLKPAAVDVPPPATAPISAAPARLAEPQRPPTPGESLHALEQEIMDTVPFLGSFGSERCGAQIAVWAGLARELRDRLTPEVSATMRPAFRIFFEHLTQLRSQMETHVVDALELTWMPPDWHSYIEVNRAHVEGRDPRISTEELHVYHRTMLRALTLPHRRRVPEELSMIITTAAAILPASDPQLQSTVRRFGSLWKAPAAPVAPPTPTDESAPRDAEPSVKPDRTEPDSDFAQPWSK